MNSNNIKVLCTSLSGRYAIALFRESIRSKCLELVKKNFIDMLGFLSADVHLKKLLCSQFLNKSELSSIFLKISENFGFCDVFLSFITQVAIFRRLSIINKIMYVFDIVVSEYDNTNKVFISLAAEVTDEQRRKIEHVVSRLVCGKVLISYSIDRVLLGGFRILTDGKIFDASLKGQLDQLSVFLKSVNV